MDYADLLYQAAKAGDIPKVKEIITNRGVNVRNDGNGLAAIQIAAKNGDLDVVKLLLREGADVRLHSKNQFKKDTALYIAAEEGHWEIVQFLLDQTNEAYLRVPVEIYEFLLQYSSKMTINKKLQEKVSTLSKI